MKTKCIWMTGLSGSGKTTLATLLSQTLDKFVIIDGDDIRKGLCKDLTFNYNGRKENLRRIRELCKIFVSNNIPVIVSCITPYEVDRLESKHSISGCKIVYIKASLEACEERDVKGLYKKARKGEINNFTGISSTYDIPINPDLVIDTDKLSIEESLNELLKIL